MIVATLLGGQLLFGNFQAYCTISTNCSQGVTCDACEHSDGVHEPNFGHDRHQNCSFVSKIGQNGPKFRKNQHRQVFMAAHDPWQNTWSVQFKVICDPWLNTWSKWYSNCRSEGCKHVRCLSTSCGIQDGASGLCSHVCRHASSSQTFFDGIIIIQNLCAEPDSCSGK